MVEMEMVRLISFFNFGCIVNLIVSIDCELPIYGNALPIDCYGSEHAIRQELQSRYEL